MSEPWWKTAVFYQIYPRSFADSNGDGIGDLEGIRSKLDYVSDLGVDAIWLSPFYPSPMDDFGYDVADYCQVEPAYGTLEGFDQLLSDAHRLSLKVIIDLVPNHTSDQHPWFIEARSSKDSPKRDWYIWAGDDPDSPPNNWVGAFTGGSAWSWDEPTGQWYLHSFLPSQPDLNWRNSEVVEAMHGVMRFWLDRGVDGFRIDVIHALFKDESLPDLPPGLETSDPERYDQDATRETIRGFREVLASYAPERMMVGEVFLLDTELIAAYYGSGDGLHLAFNFPALFSSWDAEPWRQNIEQASSFPWPGWVLSNHDLPRHRTRYDSEEAARAAAVLLLTLQGTPFMYQGEELGLRDAIIDDDRRLDPGHRDGCRAPIPWTPERHHGWGSDPWLPWPPEVGLVNAETLDADPDSMLGLYRRILAARKDSPALQIGGMELLDAPEGTLAFRRTSGKEERAVIVNFTAGDPSLDLAGSWETVVSTDRVREGRRFDGGLGPHEAVILRPN